MNHPSPATEKGEVAASSASPTKARPNPSPLFSTLGLEHSQLLCGLEQIVTTMIIHGFSCVTDGDHSNQRCGAIVKIK